MMISDQSGDGTWDFSWFEGSPHNENTKTIVLSSEFTDISELKGKTLEIFQANFAKPPGEKKVCLVCNQEDSADSGTISLPIVRMDGDPKSIYFRWEPEKIIPSFNPRIHFVGYEKGDVATIYYNEII